MSHRDLAVVVLFDLPGRGRGARLLLVAPPVVGDPVPVVGRGFRGRLGRRAALGRAGDLGDHEQRGEALVVQAGTEAVALPSAYPSLQHAQEQVAGLCLTHSPRVRTLRSNCS